MVLRGSDRWWLRLLIFVGLSSFVVTDIGRGNGIAALRATLLPWNAGLQMLAVESTVRRRTLNVQQFGALPDDGKDDSVAFSNACRVACAVRRPLLIPSGTYEIDKRTTITCTDNLCLVGQGEVRINLDAYLTFMADSVDDAILLQADAPRGSRFIIVDEARRCSAGDLVYIDTQVVAESAWNTPKREVHRIESIDGAATLRFEEPLVFSYLTTDSGLTIRAYKKRRIAISNVTFDVNDRQLATEYFSGGTILCNCRWTERDVGGQDGYLYSPGHSIGVTVSDAAFEGGYYGCIPACSRDVTFERVTGNRCAGHVIAPNNWCYGVYVKDISGSECGSLVDSHPAFEVHYSDVSGSITGLPNLRSLGGSIRNYNVKSTLSASKVLYLQNIELLVDTEIYDETTLLLENFTLTTPNLDLDTNQGTNRAVVRYGHRAILKNVNWRNFDFYPGPVWRGPRNGFHEIHVSDCNLTSLSIWGGQHATIENSRFVNSDDGIARTALSVGSGSSCMVTDTTFVNYPSVLSISSQDAMDFCRCEFADCGAVFAASGVPPKISFDSCEFYGGSGWGDVKTRDLQVLNCTFISMLGGPNPFAR